MNNSKKSKKTTIFGKITTKITKKPSGKNLNNLSSPKAPQKGTSSA